MPNRIGFVCSLLCIRSKGIDELLYNYSFCFYVSLLRLYYYKSSFFYERNTITDLIEPSRVSLYIFTTTTTTTTHAHNYMI